MMRKKTRRSQRKEKVGRRSVSRTAGHAQTRKPETPDTENHDFRMGIRIGIWDFVLGVRNRVLEYGINYLLTTNHPNPDTDYKFRRQKKRRKGGEDEKRRVEKDKQDEELPAALRH